MSLGQDIFVSFLEHAWRFVKGEREFRQVASMGPEELQQWREKEVATIHEEAVRLASHESDRNLAKRGETREDSVRVYEVLMRGRRGLEMSQCLLEGMDVRGLDLSKVMPGHISQEHMDRAVGDENTKLPSDLKTPARWRQR
jgi:hypothetical protein